MKILRVNLTDEEIGLYDENNDLWERRLIAEVLNQEIPPHCHPLGPRNKLIFVTRNEVIKER